MPADLDSVLAESKTLRTELQEAQNTDPSLVRGGSVGTGHRARGRASTPPEEILQSLDAQSESKKSGDTHVDLGYQGRIVLVGLTSPSGVAGTGSETIFVRENSGAQKSLRLRLV